MNKSNPLKTIGITWNYYSYTISPFGWHSVYS